MKNIRYIKNLRTASTFFEKNFKDKTASINGVKYLINSVGHSWLYPTQIKGWRDWDFPNQPQGIFRDVYTFNLNSDDLIVTTIRNPFDILLSYYTYDWAWCRKHHNLSTETDSIEDFQKFVDIYLDKSIVFHAPALRNSLFSQLKDSDGNWILKDDSIILRFENLENDLNYFSNITGIPITDTSIEAKNKSTKKLFSYKEAYTSEQIKKLTNLWKKDLEYFGYSFDGNQIPEKTTAVLNTTPSMDSNLKIAICFSGQIRDLERTKAYWTQIIDKYNMDVYASFWDIENSELGDTINNFHKIYNAKYVEVENFDNFDKTTLSTLRLGINPPNSLLPHLKESCNNFGTFAMWYKVWKANMLTKKFGIDYDVVIRVRTDIKFDSKMEIIKNNMLNVPFGRVKTQNWQNSDGIADLFAYGPPKIMDYYSSCVFYMMEHINNGHYMVPHEHFLHTHLNKISIPILFMDSQLTITRTSKGTPDEIYYKGDGMKAEILLSDFMQLNPNPDLSFKRNLKESFKL